MKANATGMPFSLSDLKEWSQRNEIRGESRMISEGVRFDQVTVFTLRIRKDRPEERMKTQIRHRVRLGSTLFVTQSNFTHIHSY